VVPALAVAAALRAEGAEVEFIGGNRAEAQLVPAAGYRLHAISAEGLSRTNPLHALRALGKAARAFLRARALLGEIAPDAVMGGGGYVAGPVGLAALTRRIPLVLTEADSHLGVTNRMLAPAARRVCLSFPIAGRTGPRYRVTGRPSLAAQEDRDAARARYGIAMDETCVLVFGGSLGARSINLAAIEAFATGLRPGRRDSPTTEPRPSRRDRAGATEPARLADRSPTDLRSFHVLHVCGRRDYAELAERQLPESYDLREYLDLEEFADALAAADLVVARAGGSVFEIAAHGKPAILVPYPHAAADHQAANARWMVAAGAAIAIPDGELTAVRLGREVTALLADRSRLAAMASASQSLARPDAAREIAGELLEAAGA
jgi:UDP-N-acetylglucosamine--N-acetylmuramyl-(pentapeptide) pyrophosphoryl-undecaprenol N-acetylglucosamine transferase